MKFQELATAKGEELAAREIIPKMSGRNPFDFPLPKDDIPDLFYPARPIGSIMTGVNNILRQRSVLKYSTQDSQ